MRFKRRLSKQISDERDTMIHRLDVIRLISEDTMLPLAARWAGDPAQACLDGAKAVALRVVSGGQTPTPLAAADHVALLTQARDIETLRLLEATIDLERPPQDDAWWQSQIDRVRRSGQASALPSESHRRAALQAAFVTGLQAQQLERNSHHLASLMQLPKLMVEGTPDEQAVWIDTVLAEIDPETAAELRASADRRALLNDDHEALLNVASYLALTVEVIPAAFYAHVAGLGGAMLMGEFVRLVMCAHLGSSRAYAQLGTLHEHVLPQAKAWAHDPLMAEAVTKFAENIDQFATCAVELDELGALLEQERSRFGGGSALGRRVRALLRG
ncbi:MAG: hypothetical protein RLZZ618_1593 [Pseudomonadota bacterium]|jgi:hypothetical protein